MRGTSFKKCVALLVVLCGLTMTGPAIAGKTSAPPTPPPNVTFPYTFKCPHCGMMITIKSVADWKKDCQTCACGTSNLGCYNEGNKAKK